MSVELDERPLSESSIPGLGDEIGSEAVRLLPDDCFFSQIKLAGRLKDDLLLVIMLRSGPAKTDEALTGSALVSGA